MHVRTQGPAVHPGPPPCPKTQPVEVPITSPLRSGHIHLDTNPSEAEAAPGFSLSLRPVAIVAVAVACVVWLVLGVLGG